VGGECVGIGDTQAKLFGDCGAVFLERAEGVVAVAGDGVAVHCGEGDHRGGVAGDVDVAVLAAEFAQGPVGVDEAVFA